MQRHKDETWGLFFYSTFVLLNVSWTHQADYNIKQRNTYHLLRQEIVKIEEKYSSFRDNSQFTALLQRRKNSQYSCRRTLGLKKRKTAL